MKYWEREEYVENCPLCGHGFTHWNEVKMITENNAMGLRGGGEDSSATVTAFDVDPESVGRRYCIVLSGFCESCDHTFEVRYRQHKGETYRSLFDLGPIHPPFYDD